MLDVLETLSSGTEADRRIRAGTPPARPGRRRVLLSAFASAAEGGSEVAIGWNLARHLAAFHDVTLLCTPWIGTEDFRSRNDAFLRREGPVKGLTIRYVEPPLLSRALQHGHMGFCKPFYYLGYASWQWAAYREAVRLHRQSPLTSHTN